MRRLFTPLGKVSFHLEKVESYPTLGRVIPHKEGFSSVNGHSAQAMVPGLRRHPLWEWGPAEAEHAPMSLYIPASSTL